ncbi:hypothetical protein EK904_007889 [Melospiza melodia maxima]|nr:hypothetical protein EK904_007889 [Melospiza melodia maxima]
MMAEEEGMCQEEAVEEEEEEEQNPPSAMSASALSSLVMAMQSLALCPGGDGVRARDSGLPGSRWSSEPGPPLRGTAQRHGRQHPKGDSLSLGLKNGNNRRCRRRRGRRRRRSISPCTMRAVANARRTTRSACLQEFWRLKVRTCLTEK